MPFGTAVAAGGAAPAAGGGRARRAMQPGTGRGHVAVLCLLDLRHQAAGGGIRLLADERLQLMSRRFGIAGGEGGPGEQEMALGMIGAEGSQFAGQRPAPVGGHVAFDVEIGLGQVAMRGGGPAFSQDLRRFPPLSARGLQTGGERRGRRQIPRRRMRRGCGVESPAASAVRAASRCAAA